MGKRLKRAVVTAAAAVALTVVVTACEPQSSHCDSSGTYYDSATKTRKHCQQ